MKILHTEASCGWGGQEIRILEESRGLIGRGHDIAVACPPHARLAEEAPRYGVPVVALPIEFKTFAGFLALRRHLAAGSYDVVNTHSSTDSWLAALACATLPRPPAIVRTRHVSVPVANNFANRWLYGRTASRVITTGERLRDDLIRRLDLPASQVVSIPTGVDLTRYAPADRRAARRRLGLPEEACIVGIVATLRSWKGHRYLLDAFSQLSLSDTHLVVVGDGPGRDNLRRQAAELGISGKMTMPGNQADVAPWLAALDIFVLPSYANEGVPQALMQAMSAGLPIISTPVGGIPEIITNGVEGFLIPPRDADSLRNALERLCLNPPLRICLGQSALMRARTEFSLEGMLDRMEGVFAQAGYASER